MELKSIPISGSVSILSKCCLAEIDRKCLIFNICSLVSLSLLTAELLFFFSHVANLLLAYLPQPLLCYYLADI